jgi:hypothetical protein
VLPRWDDRRDDAVPAFRLAFGVVDRFEEVARAALRRG